MIIIQDGNKNITFEVTKFPDGTSQVWRLSPEPKNIDSPTITWMYEDDAEIFQLVQLGMLLKNSCRGKVSLFAPYFPYARQDKDVSNQTTFARESLIYILRSLFNEICAFDLHSDCPPVKSIVPDKLFMSALDHDVICFPDAGAEKRYKQMFPRHKSIFASKVRNQSTGEITDIEFTNMDDINGKSVIIFDDICDGGKTFIVLANLLKLRGASRIDLCVSHGIFSQGKDILHRAGIETIYTTNSLLKNKDEFKVVNL